MKKIAVFHQFFDNIGGAEILVLTLVRELNADLYSTNIDTEMIKRMGFEDVLPCVFSIGKIPKNAPFRHQMALFKFRKLNLGSKYNFYIIGGDWSLSAAVNNKPNLWYIHSPLNELWQWKDFVREKMMNWWKRPIFDIWVWVNRKLSLKYSKSVTIWVCNSINTKNRIKKYYQKDAEVINPPIDTSKYKFLPNKNYWLSVNRLLDHKRVDLQIKAFSKMPNEKLIIVGSYEKGARQFEAYKKYLESIKTDNVEIINWVNDKELIKLFSESKGFLTTARDEDFGMTPVEAMASGKPVIACNEGGYKETVIDGKTGVLIDDINEEKIISAVEFLNKELKEKEEIYKKACQERALIFDTKIFIEKIKNLIE